MGFYPPTNTPAPQDTPVYYCPVCGQVMRQFVQQYGYGVPAVTMVECVNESPDGEPLCQLWKNTTNDRMLASGRFQADWGYVAVYDYLTGKKVSEDNG